MPNAAEIVALFYIRQQSQVSEQLIVDHDFTLIGMVFRIGAAIKRAARQNIFQVF